jgi:AraC-like DNA-binding protein
VSDTSTTLARRPAADASSARARPTPCLPAKKLVFSTDQLPPGLDDRRRYTTWRDLYETTFGSLDLPRVGNVPFFARLDVMQVGRLGVVRFSTTLARVRRTRAHLARDARDHFGLAVLTQRSGMTHTQFGREATHPAGAAALGVGGELIDFQMPAGVAWTLVNIPRAVLRERVKGAEDLAARPLNAPCEVTALLKSYASMLLRQPTPSDDAVTERISDMLLDLAVLTLSHAGESAELARQRGLRAARLQAALAEISANFAHAEFSPQDLARKLGLSPRYLQELLQEAGATFTERVLELRLQKARAVITDPFQARGVAEIALDCGFRDVSYFNRCFRRRFGDTPGGLRGQARKH